MAKVFTAMDIEEAAAAGHRALDLNAGDVVTPLAQERAQELGLVLGVSSSQGTLPDLGTLARVVAGVLAAEVPEEQCTPALVAEVCAAVMARLGR